MMAETASTLLASISFAHDASKSLYEAVSSFKSQRQPIKDVLADLDSLVTVLTTIHEQAQSSQEVQSLEPLRKPLKCCTTACQEMHEMLNACASDSKDGQLRDWLKMRYHNKSFEDMKKRLVSHKSTLVIAFQSMNIHDHSTTPESPKAFKDFIGGTREDLEDQLNEVRQAINTAEASSLGFLQTDQAQLLSSLQSIARAQRIADTTQAKVFIERSQVDDCARAIFGTDTTQPKFDLTVADNSVGVGAVVSFGVYSPQTLQALLQHPRTPDLALALRALQTQPAGTRNEAIQSVLNSIAAERNHGATYINERNLPAVPTDSEIMDGSQFAKSDAIEHGDITDYR